MTYVRKVVRLVREPLIVSAPTTFQADVIDEPGGSRRNVNIIRKHKGELGEVVLESEQGLFYSPSNPGTVNIRVDVVQG